MRCVVCHVRPPASGVLCDACPSALIGRTPISPEQVASHGVVSAAAALVDQWGRPHPLALTTRIGRVVQGPTLCVLTPNVSRSHAMITREGPHWMIRDLGSVNGTYVGDTRIETPTPLEDRARIRVGRVGFYFLATMPTVRPRTVRRIGDTIRPPSEGEATRPTHRMAAASVPDATFALHQPTGGGGAIVTINGRPVQLTLAQYELIRLLAERRLNDEHIDEEQRGFVSLDELLEKLSLESLSAETVNVRQLVRRVRRLMVKAGVGDLIESRRRRGYRLRVMPRIE